MSHFLRVQTQIREQEMLAAALRDLHYQFQEGESLVVRGYAGNTEHAQVVVDTGSQYDIGFKQSGQVYEVVADWWGVQGNSSIRQDSFIRQVNQQYAFNVVRDQAEEDYLIIERDEVNEQGEREIILVEDYRL